MDVEYPGFGTIVVFGRKYDHDVVVEDGEVRARDKGPSKRLKKGGHTPLSVREDIPLSKSRLVIGSGYSGSLPILAEVTEAARSAKVTVDIMPTAEACSLLRSLDPASVNAILHVTC